MEEFKSIPGYEGSYKIAKTGEIISFIRNEALMIKHQKTKGGYLVAGIHDTNNQSKNKNCFKSVGYLVLKTWGPPPPSPTHKKVEYIDGNRLNVELSNLRWTSQQEITRKMINRIKGTKRNKRKTQIVVVIDGRTKAGHLLRTNCGLWLNTGIPHEKGYYVFTPDEYEKVKEEKNGRFFE